MERIKRYLPFVFIISFVLALFFYETAKSWLSISIFGLVGSVILINPKIAFVQYFKNLSFFFLGLLPFILLLSIPFSDNIGYGWNRIEIISPFLAMSIAFAGAPKFSLRFYNMLLFLYVILSVIMSSFVLFNYYLNYETITESYLKAKVMPTGLNHVRFSIMIAMGCYLSYYLYIKGFTFWILGKSTFIFASLFLFLFLHIFSVRSGIIAIYGVISIELIRYVLQTKKYLQGAIFVVGILFILFTAIALLPTLNNKWTNTKKDIYVYIDKGYPNYNSLTTRLISFDAAISIFKQSPILGCGIGDIKDKTDDFFKVNYPMIDIPILPHNQFLFYLSATGIVGLILFCFTFYFPLFYRKNRKNNILLSHYVILTLSFMWEPMLETQLGVAYSVLFIFLPLNQLKSETVD